jgi:hypothetical protein
MLNSTSLNEVHYPDHKIMMQFNQIYTPIYGGLFESSLWLLLTGTFDHSNYFI